MKSWSFLLLFVFGVPAIVTGSEAGRRHVDSALSGNDTAVLADAAGSILGHYYGTKVASGFCMEQFSDMQNDFRLTRTSWSSRNKAAALETRDYALRHSLYGSERELDNYLKAHLNDFMDKLTRLGVADQKSYCFETMIMMDDETNDLTRRYRREYQLIHNM